MLMPEHSSRPARGAEPVVTADAIRTVLAALVTVGWLKLDDTVLAALGTVLAFLVSTAITAITRSRVTPNAHLPSTDTGTDARVPVAVLLTPKSGPGGQQ
ncbi:hypothetical protein [Pseudonocardia acaciae]|uniref:hypothetical protein n=1 Tax=Pseudonocardia acaciae TaxID=551276 RepID=UPI00048D7779|nr:hypothetical protein [Pseudonocardia acaciae]